MLTSGKERILIISPHADDEVLGCGGLIEKACRHKNEVKVVVAAVGDIKHQHKEKIISSDIRKQELMDAMEYLGCNHVEVLYDNKDSLLDTIPRNEIVAKLEAQIASFSPTMIFIPLPSYHQDHIILHEVCIAALRPTPTFMPVLIAMYEYPLISWYYKKFWNTGELYLDISSTIDKKINALRKHTSQLRPKNHLISPESVKQFANVRGLEIGVNYAEKYYIVRARLL